MFEEKDDTIMARWLAGELSAEEQKAFEESSEFQEYQSIIQGMERFQKPNINIPGLKEKVMQGIQTKTASPSKLIKMKPLVYVLTAAASIVLIIGLFFNKVTYRTGFGEQLMVSLPDGSTVQLNAVSEISRDRFFWSTDQGVNLIGEAFFEVEKGDGFTVSTSSGTVEVLGTKFNVRTRTSNFGLYCLEGRVRFKASSTGEQAILEKGDALRLENDVIEKEELQEQIPSWLLGRSSFSNVKFQEVIQELEAQYGIDITSQVAAGQERFTGSFVHDNLEIALKSVFLPMGFTYEVSEDGKTVNVSKL